MFHMRGDPRNARGDQSEQVCVIHPGLKDVWLKFANDRYEPGHSYWVGNPTTQPEPVHWNARRFNARCYYSVNT